MALQPILDDWPVPAPTAAWRPSVRSGEGTVDPTNPSRLRLVEALTWSQDGPSPLVGALVRPERPLIAAHSLDQDGLEAHQRCQRGSAEVFLSIASV